MTTRSTTEGSTLADSPLADPEFRERLRELPPSAKLVARILAENEARTRGADVVVG